MSGSVKFFTLGKKANKVQPKSVDEFTALDWIILVGSMSGLAIALGVMYFMQLFDITWFAWVAHLGTFTAITACVLIFLSYKIKAEDLRNVGTKSQAVAIIFVTAVLLATTFVGMTALYDIGFLDMLSVDWSTQLYSFIVIIYSLLSLIGFYDLYKSYKEKDWGEFLFVIMGLALPLFILIVAFLGIPIDAGLAFWIPAFAMSLAGALIVWRTPTKSKKSLGWFVLISFASIIAILFIFVDPLNIITPGEAGMSGTIYPGITQPNVFETIWTMFFTSAPASLMIALMTFGAIVYIFAKTLGDLVMAGQAIGAIIMVVPPLIIVMQIFAGYVTVPEQLTMVLGGPSVAAFVYGLAEVGVFTIMMTILMTFTGMIKALLR